MRTNLPVTGIENPLQDGQSIVSKTDVQGRIVYVDPTFVEVSGFTREELLGKAHKLVRHPDMPPAAFADMWRTLQDGAPWTGLVKNRRKNGDFYWVIANVVPVKEAGRVVGYISVRTRPTRAQMQLDGITRHNAALVEECAAASSSVAEQAGHLVQALAVFKIGQGSNITR